MNHYRNQANHLSYEVLKNFLFLIGLLTIAFIVFYYNSKDIKLKLAYGGASPQNYVAEKLHPENFQKNWEAAGVGKYDFSLPMRVYYYLANYCGISPSVTVYPFMFIQTFFFLFSVAFLVQTLFKNKFVTFISVIVICFSSAAGLDLSRFFMGVGLSLGYPLFYGYAFAFTFLSIAFYLRNNYLCTFIFLALSIYCHVNMGLFAIIFVGAYFLFKPRLFHNKSALIGMLIFLAIVGPHIYSIIVNASISTGGISIEQWVKSTKIFSYHWYPFTMKLFTKNAHREFFPFLLVCFFFFISFRYQDIKDEKNLKIITGSVACLIISIVGVIFSDVYPIPFLIKISSQRATGLVSFFGVLYICYYLVKKINMGNVVNVYLATFSLLVIVLSKPGIAILPLFLLIYFDIMDGYFGPLEISSDKLKVVKSLYYIAAILIALLVFVSILKNKSGIASDILINLWIPLQYLNPFHGFDFLLHGGSFKVGSILIFLIMFVAICAYLIIIGRRSLNKVLLRLLMCVMVLGFIIIALVLERDQYLRWHEEYGDVASSYMDVQLWAKRNTPNDALFMPDPSHSYGWRDFSERSSFGNLREWGYCAISYNPDAKVYLEGIKRMKEFGINVEKVTEEDIKKSKTFILGEKFSQDIRSTYYNMTPKRIQELCNKYGIDYFIVNKKFSKISHQTELLKISKIAYQNNNFVIFSCRQKSSAL